MDFPGVSNSLNYVTRFAAVFPSAIVAPTGFRACSSFRIFISSLESASREISLLPGPAKLHGASGGWNRIPEPAVKNPHGDGKVRVAVFDTEEFLPGNDLYAQLLPQGLAQLRCRRIPLVEGTSREAPEPPEQPPLRALHHENLSRIVADDGSRSLACGTVAAFFFAGMASWIPFLRAMHTRARGQLGQSGPRGVQTPEPRSMRAWL